MQMLFRYISTFDFSTTPYSKIQSNLIIESPFKEEINKNINLFWKYSLLVS